MKQELEVPHSVSQRGQSDSAREAVPWQTGTKDTSTDRVHCMCLRGGGKGVEKRSGGGRLHDQAGL